MFFVRRLFLLGHPCWFPMHHLHCARGFYCPSEVDQYGILCYCCDCESGLLEDVFGLFDGGSVRNDGWEFFHLELRLHFHFYSCRRRRRRDRFQ